MNNFQMQVAIYSQLGESKNALKKNRPSLLYPSFLLNVLESIVFLLSHKLL
jgi:hypothetical protein